MTSIRKIRFPFAMMVFVALLALAAIPLVASAHQGPELTPADVDVVLVPGDSVNIEKTVHTPEFPSELEICFLADTTGSMGSAIANVKTNATGIMTAVLAGAPGAKFCAAAYRDIGDVYEYQLTTPMTGTIATVAAGINTWVAAGGGDTPEGQLQALRLLTQAATGWGASPPVTRVIVWFGDAPGHDPAGSILPTTLAQAIAALTGPPNVIVIAVPVLPAFSGGLDGTGQATAIANATGGQVLPAATAAQVSAAILAGLGSLPVTVSMATNCAPPISATFAPPSQMVPSGTDAVFTETISVDASAAAGVYTCEDWALLNGIPMKDAAGATILERKTITVKPTAVGGATSFLTAGSGSSAGSFALLAGGIAAFVAITVGGWYTRRRWLGSRS